MHALTPIAVALAPFGTLFEAAPEALVTWAPVALAVLMGVGVVGTAAVLALVVVVSRSRKVAKTS